MPVVRGRKDALRQVECRAVGCGGDSLDREIQSLIAEGFSIRQIFQEPPSYYRVFAQRETPVEDATATGG